MDTDTGLDTEADYIGHMQRLASLLYGAAGTAQTAERLVQLSRQAIANSDAVSLSYLRHNHRPRTLAHTDAICLEVDGLQYDLGEGPCLEAITEHKLILGPELATDERWPKFGPAAAELGIGSAFAVRLQLPEDNACGALNFFAYRSNAFTEADLATGVLLAPYLTQTLHTAQLLSKTENLAIAVQTNRQIGIAIGILMARQHCTAEQAFHQLRAASQHLHRKLRDIAEEVTYTGQVPKSSRRPRDLGQRQTTT